MKIDIILVPLLIAFVNGANADSMSMTGAKWTSCKGTLCYSLSASKAGTSSFLPNKTFVRNVKFRIFERKNTDNPKQVLIAERAIWKSDKSIWLLMNAHVPGQRKLTDYYFDSNSFVITKFN